MPDMISRRRLLQATLGGACSMAAHPLVSPVVLAAAPGEQRLVVIVLRGGMDGLGVIQPYADRRLRQLRPTLAQRPGEDLHDLDGFFGLHRSFGKLMPLWQAGELSFVHAVSTPYRSKRSHFDGQDFLENGGSSPDGELTRARDGWLNRALGMIPGARASTAIAVGRAHMILLDGQNPSGSWSPANKLGLREDERQLLSRIYAGDELFTAALGEAMELADLGGKASKKENTQTVASFATKMLNQEARIAAFSLTGWDTHRNQERALDRISRDLVTAILTLRDGLGRNWDNTTVVAITEFGRTARENGNRGTDHGTGSAMVLAGGALKGSRVHGTWPGLGESDLFENRDLLPTEDLRRHCAWLLAGQFGIAASDLEKTVFPGLDMGANPGILA
ncbi:MAG: DUF1501 domain-containing protein [Pseudomonadota bacterium]